MSTNSFLFNFSKNKNSIEDNEIQYATPFKRSLSSSIDILIVMFIRGILLQLIGNFFFINTVQNFYSDFELKFGTKTPKGTPEHMEFIYSHPVFLQGIGILVFIILIGAVYYALFYSSKWQASIGKRIFNIKIVDKNNHRKVKFFDGFCYYFLTIIPYFFILILFIYISKNNISIYQVFTEIWGFTFFGIAILFAVNMSSFNKKKINFFDYLMDFEFHIGKTKSKYPW
ncbi:MAG: RDD family protein [Alphaproteobacteria bacterium]